MISATNTVRNVAAIALLCCAITGCAPAGRDDVKTRVNPKDGADMVYVPAGDFLMGSNDEIGVKLGQSPQHKVYLDAYWIYKNDVTVAQYRKFCEATGWKMPKAPDWGWQDDGPAVNVSWDDARAYCGWAATNLPTEAQWEKAARGTDGRTFPWGNDWDPGKLWWSIGVPGAAGRACAVGSYPGGASPYGCLDMAGNVWQWCADWYGEDYYAHSPARNPAGPATGVGRVLRGGSWYNHHVFNFRCASRLFNGIYERRSNYGFRCVVRAGG